MEEWSVDSLDGYQLLSGRDLLRSNHGDGIEVTTALLILATLREQVRGVIGYFDGCDAEYGLPVVIMLVGWVAEPSGCECSPRPGAIQVHEVPLDDLRVGVLVEYIADVDETLDRGDIDVINRGAVEDNSAEQGPCIVQIGGTATMRAWVIPWAILFGVDSQQLRGAPKNATILY